MPSQLPRQTYRQIKNVSELKRVIAAQGDVAALDFETTSLTPETGDVRLVQIAGLTGNYVFDCFDVAPFDEVAPLFDTSTNWVVFYSGFEMRWFQSAGVEPRMIDVQNLRKAVIGGGRYSLASMALWDLDIELPKDEQKSDWGAVPLTKAQLDYAVNDAVVTWLLFDHWDAQMDNEQVRCGELLDDLTLPVIEMESAGITLDTENHKLLVADWEKQLRRYHDEVREHIPDGEVANLRSKSQLSDYFSRSFSDGVLALWPKTEKTGQLQVTNEALTTIARLGAFRGTAVEDALLGLARFNRVDKYLSSFGNSLITMAQADRQGRIHPSFNIGAAKTLRFSSSGPNIQQVPRDRLLFPDDDHLTQVRKSFIAPPGKLLISYDYSSIELRVLALLAGDEQLLHDVVYGDVHNEVASMILGDTNDKSTTEGKARRSAAKGVSFGIIYGSGAGGLSVTMGTNTETAAKYIMQWEARYPEAFRYRRDIENEARASDGFARMIDGGTIYLGKRPDLPKCANYPVQRGAWTIMARALIRHYETLQDLELWEPTEARMLATIHDAMMDEAVVDDAEEIRAAMYDDMEAAYLDVFPGAPTERLLEGGMGPNWAELEDA